MSRSAKFDVKAAATAYRLGMTLQEIGREFGLPHETIRRHLRKAGVQMRHGGFAKRVLDWDTVEEAYRAGVAVETIAKANNCSQSLIRMMMHRHGVKRSRKRHIAQLEIDRICALYKEWANVRDVARLVRMDTSRVAAVLRAQGLLGNVPRKIHRKKAGNHNTDMLFAALIKAAAAPSTKHLPAMAIVQGCIEWVRQGQHEVALGDAI